MILDYHESRIKRKYKAVLTKPHQPFFMLGVLIAIISIAVLGLAFKGIIAIDIKKYHTLNMSILMPSALFLGFLITVLYRFLLVMPFLQKDYMRIFFVLLAGTVVSHVGFFISDTLVFLGIALVLYSHIISMKMFISAYTHSKIEDKREIFWILAAFGFGTLGSMLFAASIIYPMLLPIAINMSFYPFAVGVVFAVAQKMIPNFFILYYGVMQPNKNAYLLPSILFSLFFIAFCKSFALPIPMFFANLLGLVTTTAIFWNNRFIFRKAPAVLWILQVGAIWFIAGFIAGIFESLYPSVPSLLQVHIWGIGFITTMVIGFGSRVAMGHSGRKIEADGMTVFIFLALIPMTILRLFAIFYPELLQTSVYFWCFIFGIWTYKYAPMLTSE